MIEYCKYHPLTAATHKCAHCHTLHCDSCCHEDNFNAKKSCFICHRELESVSDTNNILPFWRRLEESFRYPMNMDSIILIIGISVLTTISSFLPFALIWFLLLTSALFKYCFCCLENTSNGDMKAPDIGEAYGGGFGLIFSLIFMVIVIISVIWASFVYIGPMFSSIVGIVLIAGFPAMIINMALTESLADALNPVKMFSLMSAIGMPYGLLLAFIMIMSGSVSFINSILGQDLSLISVILQSIVSNYYMIVVFHIMGYMIFQFQKELGFQTNIGSRESGEKKPVLQKHMERIDVLLKEGQYHDVIKGYKEIMENYPREKDIKPRYFELLLASHNREELIQFMPDYFNFQLLANRKDQIPITYKRVLKVYPEYLPDSPEQRLKLATICHENGDAVTVVKLINGIYQTFPDFEGMYQAYALMAEALELLPNREKQAAQCRAFLKKLV